MLPDLTKLDPKTRAALVDRLAKANMAYFSSEYIVGPAEEPFNGKILFGPHQLVWSEMIARYKRIINVAYRGSGKSYYHSCLLPIWKAWKHPDQRILLFSSEEKRAKETLQDVKSTLEKSPKLQHLIPDRGKKGAKWSELSVRLTNGTEIIAVGWGQATRGRHPILIVVDDVLTDKVLYFQTERERSHEYFLGTVSGMAVPKTQIVCVGTIFHRQDMWSRLLDNKEYAYTIFPALRHPTDILPGIVPPGNRDAGRRRGEGQIEVLPPTSLDATSAVPPVPAAPPDSPIAGLVPMWPEVHNLEFLLSKRNEQGEIIFTREFLCVPVSSLSSLFPIELTLHPDQLLEEASLGQPLDWWERTHHITKTFGGIDLAISAKIGADFTCIFILGLDDQGNRYILDIHRHRGMAFDDQLQLASQVASKYQVDKLACESNAFQVVFAQKLKQMTDLPIKEFHTGKAKHSIQSGIPSLRILHENKKYRLPVGDQASRQFIERWAYEFAGFSVHEGKVVSSVDHDDVALANYICESAITDSKFQFTFAGHKDMTHLAAMSETDRDARVWGVGKKKTTIDWFGGAFTPDAEIPSPPDPTAPGSAAPAAGPTQMQRALRQLCPWLPHDGD